MIRRALPAIGFLLLAAPGLLEACTCSKAAAGPCPWFGKDEVIFLGTVIQGETLPEAAPPGGAAIAHYRFQVDELFAGGETAKIDIYSGGNDGDCAYRFAIGGQYVVFPYEGEEGRLFATICSGTRPAGEARALLPQLRALRRGQRVASIFGELRRTEPPLLKSDEEPDDPVPNVALMFSSRYNRFRTSTDDHGVFSLYGALAGEYRLSADLPPHTELSEEGMTGPLVSLYLPADACYEDNLDAVPSGRIRGSVLGLNGKPLELASVELFRAGHYADSRPGLWQFQGKKAFFEFDHIGPGRYILVFNRPDRLDPDVPFARAFYPGVPSLDEAEPVTLQDGQQLQNVNIRLEEAHPTRRIRIRLKWNLPKDVTSVYVFARAERGENPAVKEVSEDLYEFTLLQGVSYSFEAWANPALRRSNAAPEAEVCRETGRFETKPIMVDGADTQTQEMTLTFAPLQCEQ